MSVRECVLFWDGIYDPAGRCNSILGTADTLIGVQARLWRLGFYEGPVDGATQGADFSQAVREFRAFPNQAGASGSADLDGELQAELRAYFEDQVPRLPTKGSTLMGSRSEPTESANVGLTLTQEDLSVRIVAVPTEIRAYETQAGVRIRIGAFEKVRSLLFRVYHSYDASTDRNGAAIPLARLAYQEVLYDTEILNLPGVDVLPKLEDVGEGVSGGERRGCEVAIRPDVAAIMRHKRCHRRVFARPEDAPYKFRVWVSSDPDAFRAYDATKRDEWLRVMDAYDTTGLEPREFDRDPKPTDATPSTSTTPEDPTVEAKKTVFDQSSTDANWTGDDGDGVNLMLKSCATHDATFTAANAFPAADKWTTAFPFAGKNLLDDPVGVYMGLYLRAKTAADGNFSYPELKETFDEMKRHINRIRQRLCCGRDAHMPKSFRDHVNEYLNKVAADVVKVEQDSYPYKDCVRLCAKFIEMYDWIVFQTQTTSEIRQYQLSGKDADGYRIDSSRLLQQLGRSRTAALTRRNDPQAAYATQYTIEQSTPGRTLKEAYADSPIVTRSSGVGEKLNRILAIRDMVVVPSYMPLDEAYFTRIRQVPVYLMGMIDLDYLNADAHKYAPLEFLSHDAFHTISNLGASETTSPQLWHWMLRRLKQITGQAGFPPDDEDRRRLLALWDENANVLRDAIDRLGDEDLKAACEILAFCVLHEPVQTNRPGVDKPTISFPPAMPDALSIRWRLAKIKPPEPPASDENAAPVTFEKSSDDFVVNSDMIARITTRCENYWFSPDPKTPEGKRIIARLPDAARVILDACKLMKEVRL